MTASGCSAATRAADGLILRTEGLRCRGTSSKKGMRRLIKRGFPSQSHYQERKLPRDFSRNVTDTTRRVYPSWTVLKFRSILLRLKLGNIREPKDSQNHDEFDLVHSLGGPKSAKRPPAFPLLCSSGNVVGSLDPDGGTLWSDITEEIDCIVMARSQTILRGSALLKLNETHRGPFDLLYVLAVEWREGVAYRWGAGQVYESVLEASIPSGPELKVVQLG